MNSVIVRIAILLLWSGVWLSVPVGAAAGEVWDLAAQWPEVSNPCGAWSLESAPDQSLQRIRTVATQSGEVTVIASDPGSIAMPKPLRTRVNALQGPLFAGAFPGGVQPAWTPAEGTLLPTVFHSRGGTAFDLPAGSVGGHTPFVVRWTAPRDVCVQVEGGVWMARQIDRIVGVALGRTSAATGESRMLFNEVPIPWRNSSYDASHPFAFSQAMKLLRGTDQPLREIDLKRGDSLWLWLKTRKDADDFVGIDWVIRETDPQSANPAPAPLAPRLFDLPTTFSQWGSFRADGFEKPVTGVVYGRETPATCGMPLGGIDTGCIDLETGMLWGFSTLFNSHVPRRGPINQPVLGMHTAGKTWVLCDPDHTKVGMGNFQPPFLYHMPQHFSFLAAQGDPIAEPYTQELRLPMVSFPSQIHYWGHYPVADVEFETDSPVQVGVRAWTPFVPGNIKASTMPAMVFELRARNANSRPQEATLAFNFPGPTTREAGTSSFKRTGLDFTTSGVLVEAPKASYALLALGADAVRTGGPLGEQAVAWQAIGDQLPRPSDGDGGSSLAIDLKLKPGEERVVRVMVAWSAPDWNAGGKNWSTVTQTFRHQYARDYPDASETAQKIAAQHSELLDSIMRWQRVIYTEPDLPGWLADSLINTLHLITETGMWAQGTGPLAWAGEEGLFGMNECPRTCPQIECIPCGFYGNFPLVFLFPELAVSTYHGYSKYQFEDGAAPWVWGGWTNGKPPVDFASPGKGYQHATNGISLAAMLDRLVQFDEAQRTEWVREFYPVLKKNLIYTVGLNTNPELTPGQRILAMPDHDHSEWFEAGNPAWFGLTTHVGGLHLVQLMIGQRMAKMASDADFERQCEEWISLASTELETHLWNGTYYLNCYDPVSRRKDDLVFAYQLDAEWIARQHGLPHVFKPERIKATLETIRRANASISRYGVVNYAHADGSPAPVGGYGPYSFFPPEVLMLAMLYIYEGDRAYGLELAERCWRNIVCQQRYTWDMPNIMRGDQDTGERGFLNGGHDYYQDMLIWALPLALRGQTLSEAGEAGQLMRKIVEAGR